MKTPLEIARERKSKIYTCLDCENCVKVGGWFYCEDDGKMLHPYMIERTNSIKCDRAKRREPDGE